MTQRGKEHVEEKYEGFREAAREHTHFRLANRILQARLPVDLYTLDFIAITDAALDQADNWWESGKWRRLVGQMRPYLRRFELAIWHNGRLLALAIGRASRGADNVTIHRLERCKDNNPLAGNASLIMTDAADNYARVIGRNRLKLKQPEPSLCIKYASFGFSLAETYRGVTYWDRKIQT